MLVKSEKFFTKPSINYAGRFDYMCIEPISKTLISAIAGNTDQERRNYEASDYLDVAFGIVRLRTLRYTKWELYHYKVYPDAIWWEIRSACYEWKNTSIDVIPEWAHRMFKAGRKGLEVRRRLERTAD